MPKFEKVSSLLDRSQSFSHEKHFRKFWKEKRRKPKENQKNNSLFTSLYKIWSSDGPLNQLWAAIYWIVSAKGDDGGFYAGPYFSWSSCLTQLLSCFWVVVEVYVGMWQKSHLVSLKEYIWALLNCTINIDTPCICYSASRIIPMLLNRSSWSFHTLVSPKQSL